MWRVPVMTGRYADIVYLVRKKTLHREGRKGKPRKYKKTSTRKFQYCTSKMAQYNLNHS